MAESQQMSTSVAWMNLRLITLICGVSECVYSNGFQEILHSLFKIFSIFVVVIFVMFFCL